MQLFTTILFWLGIAFMVDGSLALLFQERWQKLVGRLDIRRLALAEIGVALLLLGGHYMLQINLN